jgi:hypothetical protein
MYFGTFLLTSDGEQTLLRLDCGRDGTAEYRLTDSNGTVHDWSRQWRYEDDHDSFPYSVLAEYLDTCVERGWSGRIAVVHCAFGVARMDVDAFLHRHLFLTSVEKPDHLALQ